MNKSAGYERMMCKSIVTDPKGRMVSGMSEKWRENELRSTVMQDDDVQVLKIEQAAVNYSMHYCKGKEVSLCYLY